MNEPSKGSPPKPPIIPRSPEINKTGIRVVAKPVSPVSSVNTSSKPIHAEDKDAIDPGLVVLQKFMENDRSFFGALTNGISKRWLIAVFIMVGLFIIVLVGTTVWNSYILNKMNKSYTNQMNQIILSKAAIENTNTWERLPPGQKKEKLREQYYSIIRYYTNASPFSKKMNDDQILQSFNQLWLCTERISTVNFFFPVAYMKAMTNFNPYFNVDGRVGLASFNLKGAEYTARLDLIKTDPVFKVEFKGSISVTNPIDTMKMLVARIDDLSKTFNGREDWIFFALTTNEYEVLEKYWNDGNGQIPDEFYLKGPMADCLRYYQAFKNWEIPIK